MKAYRSQMIKQVPLYSEMHRFIPIYVTWAGARLIEVPVRHHPRTRGVSKYGLSRVFKVLLDLKVLKVLLVLKVLKDQLEQKAQLVLKV